MKITLLGHYDIASLSALNRLIGLLPEHEHTVLLSGSLASSEQDESLLAALTEYDGSLCQQFLSGALDVSVAEPLAQAKRGRLAKPNSPEGLQVLADSSPELVVTIRYRHILRDAAIAVPQLGVLNLHSGILPDYRGVMATFWAMLDGAEEIGTTLHWIVDSGIDTGPVVEICKHAVLPNRSYLANVLGLYENGCDSIAKAVRVIAAGDSLPQQQQSSGGRYFSAPKAGDIHRFQGKGRVLFDGEESKFL